MQNINAVVITGNLTRDPELQSVGGGTSLCRMRVAVNSRVKRDGEWQDKANYFDVAVFGGQAENCNRYLSKGRPVAINGRLDWNEYTDKDGNKRQSVSIIADAVQFLGGNDSDNGGGSQSSAPPVTQASPAADQDFAPSGAAADDDIPF